MVFPQQHCVLYKNVEIHLTNVKHQFRNICLIFIHDSKRGNVCIFKKLIIDDVDYRVVIKKRMKVKMIAIRMVSVHQSLNKKL